MAIARNVVEALTSFIIATGTQERAILIGGQAIRDWHSAQAHALSGAAISLPIPRATTDMDVHLLIEKEEREDVARAIEADWIPTPERTGERVFQFTTPRSPSTSSPPQLHNLPIGSNSSPSSALASPSELSVCWSPGSSVTISTSDASAQR